MTGSVYLPNIGNALAAEIDDEIGRAERHGKHFASLHEAYAVILEELDEVWVIAKQKRKDRIAEDLRKELIQTAAMAIKAVLSNRQLYRRCGMKYLMTFFAGALFMSACVVASNSQPGWMFLFGAVMASCVILVSRRVRVGRVGPWQSGAELAPRLQSMVGCLRRAWRIRPLLAATLLKRAAQGLGQQIPPSFICANV